MESTEDIGSLCQMVDPERFSSTGSTRAALVVLLARIVPQRGVSMKVMDTRI